MNPKTARASMDDCRVATALGLWLASFFALMLVKSSDSPVALVIPLLAATAAAIVVVSAGEPLAVLSDGLGASVALLFVAIVGSYLANAGQFSGVFMAGNIVCTVMAFFVAAVVASRFRVDYRRVLFVHALACAALMPVVLVHSSMVWGRLVHPTIQPNYIGMVALLGVLGGLGASRWRLRLPLCVGYLALIVLVSSRASLLAALVAIAVESARGLWRMDSVRLRRLGAVAVGVLVAGAAAAALTGRQPWHLVERGIDAAFMLNDPYRGLSSGGSGRTELWNAALDLWRSSPLVGVGFKAHMKFMPEGMVAHNAYLGMLADCGLLGLFGYLALVGVALRACIRQAVAGDGPLRLTLVLCYLVYGLFESRAFGFGNAFSVLFLLIAFDAGKRPRRPDGFPMSDCVPT